jgi:hypothetical protein
MGFNARLDASHHGPPHPFQDAGIVADSLDRHPQCDGEVFLRCQQEPPTQESSGVLTRKIYMSLGSVEAMQWVLIYMSLRRDR